MLIKVNKQPLVRTY